MTAIADLRAENERLRAAFRNADAEDWRRLLGMIDDSGHGRFWREVLIEVRSTLSRTKKEPSDEHHD